MVRNNDRWNDDRRQNGSHWGKDWSKEPNMMKNLELLAKTIARSQNNLGGGAFGNGYPPATNPQVNPFNNPFGAPSNPFGVPNNPFGAPNNDFGIPNNPFGSPNNHFAPQAAAPNPFAGRRPNPFLPKWPAPQPNLQLQQGAPNENMFDNWNDHSRELPRLVIRLMHLEQRLKDSLAIVLQAVPEMQAAVEFFAPMVTSVQAFLVVFRVNIDTALSLHAQGQALHMTPGDVQQGRAAVDMCVEYDVVSQLERAICVAAGNGGIQAAANPQNWGVGGISWRAYVEGLKAYRQKTILSMG
ncbi:hypothetical protein B0T26DRAFT_677805 [Lasiosphaeria miniovina]|uniref:Uncharacterized protein n=1 Tax=Lasiosphaeria miniovina TaxID=1954250 RepID=A0AA40ACQ6_9PEZI|nr:uncharacterized protein B0T26DRAFT_677805 [Lasiosphaeria miniovina]KAK0713474.1 hypothetical protein B0T26DRAFT_677805 [Lasiosphaeria miniovina]